MELFNYLRDVSICMALCYLPYLLIFKRLTFFTANRYYLLFIVVASLVIPALHIKVIEPLPISHAAQYNVPVHNGNIELEDRTPAATQGVSLNWLLITGLAYGMVCLVMLSKMCYSVFKIVRQAKTDGIRIGENCVVHNDNANNSSFFNIIFLQSGNADKLEMEQVLAHEQVHARLLHSADNLFMEAAKVFFWFNPFVYLIANTLKEVHEYEVDQALKNIFEPKQYASLLVKLSARPAMSLANQFSAYSLKGRVKMLFKPHSPAYKKWCYLLALPVVMVTGYWFSIERVYGKTALKKDFVLVLDAGHGGKEYGVRGIGGHYEKDMALEIVREIKLVAAQRGIQTILTRSDDRSLDIHNRVDNKGDAFISIHLNDTYSHDKKDNGTMILVSKNSLTPFSKKLAADVKTSLQQLKRINADHEIQIVETSQNLYILKHNKVPAILIETGYINNQNDMNYILDPNGRHAIAEKIIDAVVTYGNAN